MTATRTSEVEAAKALIAASPAAGLVLSDSDAWLLRSTARKVAAARAALAGELAAIRRDLEEAERRITAGGTPNEGNFATRGGKADSLIVKVQALQEMFNEIAGAIADPAAA